MMGDRIVVERVVWPSGGVASTAVSLDSPVIGLRSHAKPVSPPHPFIVSEAVEQMRRHHEIEQCDRWHCLR